MQTDEQFAEFLRQRAEAAAPDICVHTERVVPRARHRRATVRAMATGLAVAVVATGGWALDARPWSAAVPPPASLSVPPAVEGTPQVPATTDDGLASGTHWYALTRSVNSETEYLTEVWVSRSEPGLVVYGADLSTATGLPPLRVIGPEGVAGKLPAEPDALEAALRASPALDRGRGTDDDKLMGLVNALLMNGGLLPPALRSGAWQVATALPAAAVSAGTDTTGRSGHVLEYVADGYALRLVLDPATGLLLEEEHEGTVTTYLEQGPTSDLPLEPTLESSGCTSWDTC